MTGAKKVTGSMLAEIFRFLFRRRSLRKHFFGFYSRAVLSKRMFSGVRKNFTFRSSITLELAIDEWIPANLYFCNTYEEKELQLLEKLLNEGCVFVDVGANIGLYTLTASRLCGGAGRVYAFEPFSENFKILSHQVALNSAANVHLENKAVSDQDAFLEILYDEAEMDKGTTSAYLHHFTKKEKVACTSLDTYLGEINPDRVDLIKIDIEGGEYAALKGMKRTLEKFAPHILIEINPSALEKAGSSEQAIIELLRSMNYVQVSGNTDSMNYLFRKGKGM